MDPTLNSLAHRLRTEMLAEPTYHHEHKSEWVKPLLHRLGSLLVMVGKTLQTNRLEGQKAFEDGRYASLDNEVCA